MAGRSLTIGDLIYRLGFENEEAFVAGMEKMLAQGEKASEDSGRKAGRGWTDQFKAVFSGAAIGSFLGTALSSAFQGALRATSQFVDQSLKDYQAYEQGLLELRRAGETNLQPFEDRMRRIAEQSRVFSRIDVSQALSKLIGAGRDANEVYDLLEVAIKGATAEVNTAAGTFGDLAEMGMMLDNVLRALGLDISQAGRVMDVLAMSAQESNLTVSEMTNVIARVGPTANLAGIEVEQLAAMAATLSNNGWEASRIATGLNSVLNSLVSQPKNVREAFDSMGLSLVKSNGEMRDISEVMRNLGELADGSGESLLFLGEGFDTFSLQVAAALGSNSEDLREFADALYEAEGAADDLARTAQQTATGGLAEMQARMADARIELGERLLPVMVDLYQNVLPHLVTGIGWMIELWEAATLAITGTTAALQRHQEAVDRAEQSNRAAAVAGMGETVAAAWAEVQRLDQEIADLDHLIRTDFGARIVPAYRQRLDALREDRAEAYEAFRELREQLIEARRLQDEMDPGGAPPPTTVPGEPSPGVIDEVAEAYRNLATIQEELKNAREARDQASSPAEEAALRERVRLLEEEEEARRRILGLVTTRAGTAPRPAVTGPTTDPLVDEARRVTADTRRLRDAYDLELLTRQDYTDQLEAHQRRLWGLLHRAETPEQSATILAALKSNGQTLETLARENLQRIEDAHREYTASRLAQAQAEQAELDRIQEAATRRRERREATSLRALEAAHREYTDSLRQAQVLQEAQAARQAASDARREATALRELETAHRAYTDSLRAAQQLEAERAARQAASDARREATALRDLEAAHREYTDSLRAAQQLEVERAAREAASQARREATALRELEAAHRTYTDSLREAYRLEQLRNPTIEALASGALVRYTKAQLELGRATSGDVQTALENQIAALEEEIEKLPVATEEWYALVAALAAARIELERMATTPPPIPVPGNVPAPVGPDMDAIQAQAAELAQSLTEVAASFPKALVSGIQNGDIAGALRSALGSATDFFLDQMLKAILGPITEQLTKSIASSMAANTAGGVAGAAGALNPWMLALGAGALILSMLTSGRQRQQETARSNASVQRTVSNVPDITYILQAQVTVEGSSWSDPAFYARWRSETEGLLLALLAKVKKGER